MLIENAKVVSLKKITGKIFLIKVLSPQIASLAKPGQFCNIKVTDNLLPLLRRPFSICNINGDSVSFLFDTHGEGTKLLAGKKKGDALDILGPLGNGFNYESDFDLAVIVAGGMGSAPFPFLIDALKKRRKNIICIIGGRNEKDIITYGMKNIFLSTDDGSNGYNGNVIQLAAKLKDKFVGKKVQFFGCGPNAMLKALKEFCAVNNFNCQVSTESAMACGFGICQGCPIPAVEEDKYFLVCKDGPVFNSRDIIL